VLTTGAAGLMLFKLLFVRPLALIRSALDVPVLAWLIVCLVCTFHTVNWRLSVHGVYEDFEGITTWVMYVFLFWWPLQHVRTERQIRLVFGAVVLAGTVAGFYGLLQNFGIDFVPWNPDTYNPERMFSTMGNPNFLAAYTVMSMPITFIFFLDLPAKIRTDKAFGAVLVLASLVAMAALCVLFSVDYFNFEPASFGATGFFGMLLSLKFWVSKILLAFPVICAVLLFYGRLRWIMLLSLVGQLMSTLFTKSRGGVFAMAAIIIVFAAAFAFEVFGTTVLFSLTGVLVALGALALGVLVLATGFWQTALAFAFTDHPWLAFILFVGALAGVRWLVRRKGGDDLLARNLDYVIGLLLMVWALFFIQAIRQTTFEMLERVSKLFHPSEVKYTPRLFIWKSALRMLRDNIAFGTGLDTFQISFPPYREALYWILEWNGTRRRPTIS
jgi:O-antigen ligase